MSGSSAAAKFHGWCWRRLSRCRRSLFPPPHCWLGSSQLARHTRRRVRKSAPCRRSNGEGLPQLAASELPNLQPDTIRCLWPGPPTNRDFEKSEPETCYADRTVVEDRALRKPARFSVLALLPLLLLLFALPVSCLLGAGDECTSGTSACDGDDSVKQCMPPTCAEPGCSGTKWQSFWCQGERCIEPEGASAQCAQSPLLDPLCHDSLPYCANNHAVTCIGNYAVGSAVDCGSIGCQGQYCARPADPECADASATVCSGNRSLICAQGHIVDSTDCVCAPGATCCVQGECASAAGASGADAADGAAGRAGAAGQ